MTPSRIETTTTTITTPTATAASPSSMNNKYVMAAFYHTSGTSDSNEAIFCLQQLLCNQHLR